MGWCIKLISSFKWLNMSLQTGWVSWRKENEKKGRAVLINEDSQKHKNMVRKLQYYSKRWKVVTWVRRRVFMVTICLNRRLRKRERRSKGIMNALCNPSKAIRPIITRSCFPVSRNENEIPKPKETSWFWRRFSSDSIKYNEGASWLHESKDNMHDEVVISLEEGRKSY